MQGNDYYIEIFDDEDEITIERKEKTKISKNKKQLFSKKEKKRIKFWIIILLLSLIFVFYESIIIYIQELFKTNPTVYKIYLGIESEILGTSLLGLFYVSMLGSLFFLAFPGEAIFIFFLSQTNYFFPIIIAI